MTQQDHAKWLIKYADGSTVTSHDMAPWEVPRRGVICIVQFERRLGKRSLVQQNFYCWHKKEEKWVPHDLSGLNQYLDDINEAGIRLQGYWVPDETYQGLLAEAMSDQRIPKQTCKPAPMADLGE